MNANFEDSVNGFEVEIDAFGKCFGTDDFNEGTTAFLEKRKPRFNFLIRLFRSILHKIDLNTVP